MIRIAKLFMSAVAFLTRVPVPQRMQAGPEALAGAAVFFPVVGLLVSAGAIILNHVFSRFVAHGVMVVIVLAFLVTVTGGLHEDALADAADGFGGGWSKDQILSIMRDSRVGSFGALAIALTLLARFVFLSNIPPHRFDGYLVAGQVTSRWTALPLAFFLPPAREQSGQGARVAGKITAFTLVLGTLITLALVATALRTSALWVMFVVVAVTALSGAYYRFKIGGVTGDCLGATNQIVEVATYLTGCILR
jgi:adenosylcobinamide-GDP ribazoletransferase